MLPPDFHWTRRYEQSPPDELALRCGGHTVAQLTRKVGGEWVAMLTPFAEPMSPWISRDCASRETGITGIEAWAARHADALRQQAAIVDQRRARLRHSAV